MSGAKEDEKPKENSKETKKETKEDQTKKEDNEDNEEESEKSTEKKAKKKRGGKKRKAEAPATPSTRPQRERKSVTKFKFDDKKEKGALDIKEGNGVALGEHPNVEQNLTKVKAVDPTLKKLHRILFGTVGKKLSVKRNIRKFSGFVVEGDKAEFKEELETKLGKLERSDLKDMAAILDTETSGSKAELTANLTEFLLNPKPSKTKKSGGLKRGRKSTKKSTKKSSKKGTKKGKKEKGKRKPSGYMLFGKEHRPQVREENPDLKFGEVTKEVAKLWNELSDKQKEKYNDRAKEEGDAEDGEDDDDDEEKPKKKKKVTKKKEKKEKKEKKKKKKEKSDEEEEEKEKEKEPDLPAEVKDKLKAAVKEIIAKSDDEITNKEVRAELKKTKEFSDLIKKHKSYVKGLINQLATES